MNILVLNAGSASLKFEVIATPELPSGSDKQRKLVSGFVEGIGEQATFSLLENKDKLQQEKIAASDYGEATRQVLKWLEKGRWQDESTAQRLDALGHRIVHGGDKFTEPVVIDKDRKYVGAYLAALGGAQAVIFGGGIGENTPFVRTRVLEELEWCGLTLDPVRNEQTINSEGRITTDSSRLHAYVIPVEEGLLIADQTLKCLKAS